MLVVERVVASVYAGAAELVAGHSAVHSGADVAVAGVAELQLVAVAAAAGERELVLVLVPVPVLALALALVLVVLEPFAPVVVPVIVHSDEFDEWLAVVAVGGRVG